MCCKAMHYESPDLSVNTKEKPMEEEQSHFIKNIEIKNFKCFENFSAEGFGRVNLIGGKNNVGKTAFMEACYLINGLSSLYKKGFDNRDELYFDITKLFLTIEQNRKGSDFLLEWLLDTYELNHFSNFKIELPEKFRLSANNNMVMPEKFYKYNYGNDGNFKLSEHRENQYFYKVRQNKQLPNIQEYSFATPCNNTYETMKKLMGKIKKLNKNDYLNSQLKSIFNIEKIDLTDNDIIVFENESSTFKSLSEYGDGIKHFLNIVLTLLTNNGTVIYLDEIENGIHYTNLDKLWDIILTISKEQKVQVFATTHSKECIESFNRVQQKLKDKDTYYFEMYKNIRKDNITMRKIDEEQLAYELKQGKGFRGE